MRTKKQFGVRAKAGPVRDPAIPAAGEVDVKHISDHVDLGADIDGVIRTPSVISTPDGAISAPGALSALGGEEVVREETTLGIMRGGAGAVTKEEGVAGDICQNNEHLPELVDLIEDEAENDGFIDRLSHIFVREQRIAKARQVLGLNKELEERGDQADQAAAEERITTDVTKVLQLLRSPEEVTIRKAFQRLHVKRYHCPSERLQ